MIFLYRILINFIVILSPIILIIRIIKKKEHPIRFKEKFSIFSKKRRPGKLIWFHGASVGEILSIMPLVKKLEKNKKINQILITSSTLSSANIFTKFNFKKTVHQFFPVDTNFNTKKFLSYWKPSLAIFIDSEIWPNMLTNLKKKSIPHVLINARITKKSYKRWKLLPALSKNLFKNFAATYPANKETSKYLKSLGAKKIKFLGNLKFSENELDKKNTINHDLKKFLKNKIHWCAASTHEDEELICSHAYLKLQKKKKNLVTIIIPRHINRSQELVRTISKIGLKVHCHSWKKKIDKHTQIYLVDTYGETKSFFKISKVVFLGGSIINHGGQNPLEAARYGCKIMHGPNIQNFKEIYDFLEKSNFTVSANNSNQISINLSNILKNKIKSKLLTKKIKILGVQILNSTLKEVENFIVKNED